MDPSQPVFAHQKALVTKVISELGHHANIVWEVANEPSEHNGKYLQWLSKLAAHITATETSLGLDKHLVIPRDIPGHQLTAGHWNANDNVSTVHSQLVAMWKQQSMAPQPRPLLADDDCGGVTPPALYARQRAWAALTAGAQSSFLNITIRDRVTLQTAAVRAGMAAVGSVARFLTHKELHVQLRGMEPADQLVSTGWCLARTTSSAAHALSPELIVFLREGQGSTTVKHEVLRNGTAAHWFSPESGAVQQATGSAGTFTTPDTKGDWALHISQRSSQAVPVVPDKTDDAARVQVAGLVFETPVMITRSDPNVTYASKMVSVPGGLVGAAALRPRGLVLGGQHSRPATIPGGGQHGHRIVCRAFRQ